MYSLGENGWRNPWPFGKGPGVGTFNDAAIDALSKVGPNRRVRGQFAELINARNGAAK